MRVILFFVIILISSCNNSPKASRYTDKRSKEVEDSEMELAEIRRDYERLYHRPVIMDTAFLWRDTTYFLHFEHYAKMDSGIKVPSNYNFDISREFITHNFESKLIVTRDSDTVLNEKITKQTFKNDLTPELASYGTLLYPILQIQADNIILHYSLSIPVTDIGMGVGHGFLINGGAFTKGF